MGFTNWVRHGQTIIKQKFNELETKWATEWTLSEVGGEELWLKCTTCEAVGGQVGGSEWVQVSASEREWLYMNVCECQWVRGWATVSATDINIKPTRQHFNETAAPNTQPSIRHPLPSSYSSHFPIHSYYSTLRQAITLLMPPTQHAQYSKQ